MFQTLQNHRENIFCLVCFFVTQLSTMPPKLSFMKFTKVAPWLIWMVALPVFGQSLVELERMRSKSCCLV
jgi:hypothetical protein